MYFWCHMTYTVCVVPLKNSVYLNIFTDTRCNKHVSVGQTLQISSCISDTVNPNGTNCPYALKMLACLILEEITTFLRETFQHLPRKKHKLEPGWDKHLTSRRFSSIISSPGHSDRSSESNIGDLPQSSQGL